jgi:hypothetical protein
MKRRRQESPLCAGEGTIDKVDVQEAEVKPKNHVKHDPPDKRLLKEPKSNNLDELQHFYTEQIGAFYSRPGCRRIIPFPQSIT